MHKIGKAWWSSEAQHHEAVVSNILLLVKQRAWDFDPQLVYSFFFLLGKMQSLPTVKMGLPLLWKYPQLHT